MNIKDHFLIQTLKEGDEKSFELIFKTYYNQLFFYIKQYVNEEEVSENIVQDVFQTLWEKRTTLNDKAHLTSWLFTVAKNKSINFLEKRISQNKYNSHLKNNLDQLNYNILSETNTSPLAFEEIEHIYNETLESLSPKFKQAFLLSRIEDKTYSEIAEIMQVSQKSVEYYISNALAIFRTNLKDYLPLLVFLLR